MRVGTFRLGEEKKRKGVFFGFFLGELGGRIVSVPRTSLVPVSFTRGVSSIVACTYRTLSSHSPAIFSKTGNDVPPPPSTSSEEEKEEVFDDEDDDDRRIPLLALPPSLERTDAAVSVLAAVRLHDARRASISFSSPCYCICPRTVRARAPRWCLLAILYSLSN